MEWKKQPFGKATINITSHQATTETGYLINIESYAGIGAEVCEWEITSPRQLKMAAGVCYGVHNAKAAALKVIEAKG